MVLIKSVIEVVIFLMQFCLDRLFWIVDIVDLIARIMDFSRWIVLNNIVSFADVNSECLSFSKVDGIIRILEDFVITTTTRKLTIVRRSPKK